MIQKAFEIEDIYILSVKYEGFEIEDCQIKSIKRQSHFEFMRAIKENAKISR